MKKRMPLWMASLVLAVVLLVGCGQAPSPAVPEAPPTGGDLVMAVLSDAVTLDPHTGNDISSSNVTYNLYETLVIFDRNNVLQPLLATEWKALDDLTWEFVLRKGVKFHDGTELKAQNVKASFERLLDPAVASPRLFLFSMIEEITVVDEYTVRFKTEFPFAPLPAHLAHNGGAIISLEAIEKDYAEMKAGKKPGSFLAQNPVGTGPFRLESWEPGNRLTLVRNEDYWGQKARLKSVTFKVVPENLTRLSELETGYVHIADPIQPGDVNRVARMPNAYLHRKPSASLTYIGFNCRKPPFDDVRVRQAISMAINKDDIVEGVYRGTAIPAVGPIAPGVFGFDPSVRPMPYDREKAKQLLAAAGLENGFSTTIWSIDYPVHIQIADYVQSILRDLNITVTRKVMEWGAYLESVGEGKHEMFILGWSTPTLDGDYAMYALFHSANRGKAGNLSFFMDEKVDELLDKGRQEADPAKRLAFYREAQERLVDLAPMLYLIHGVELTGVSTTVKNFDSTPARMFLLRDVYIEK